MNNALQDLRYAVRMLRKSPAVTAIATLSLALGIGANTAIFSLVDAVLLRSLPVHDPSRLVLLSDPNGQGVSMGNSNGVRQNFSYGEYGHLRDRQQVFEDMYASQSEVDRGNASIDGGGSEIIRERLVTGSYFSVLGVKPLLGRTFTSADDRVPHGAPYAVISYEYWRSRFGSRGDVLGKRITIGRAPLTIIGVAPPGFFGETVGQAPDVWIPMMMQPDVMPGRDWLKDDETKVLRVMWLQVMGRLKPGVTLQQAQANVDVIFKQLLSGYQIADLDGERRTNFLNQSIKVRPGAAGANAVSEHFGTALLMLMAVVGFVLLIACANIANLVLARAAARHRELGIRVALGAARHRLAAQMITESLLLALLGGALGLVFAAWSTQLLLQLVGGEQPVPIAVQTDWRVLGFTALLAILTGILFGLAPAIRAGRVDVSSTLKENARNVSGSGSRVNLGKVLVVSQIAISLLLLIGAGLFIRTFRNLLNVDLGYNREKLILVYVDALSAGYKEPALVGLYNTLAGEIRSIPGVKAVAYSQNGLFSGSEMGTALDVEGYAPKNRRDRGARFDLVGPNYFSSLGIPIIRGREIAPQDISAAAPPVCVINERMARDMFAGRDPLGKQIRDLFPGSKGHCEIIGVARNVRDHSLRGDVPRRFYTSVAHGLGGLPPGVNYEVRTVADPAQITSAIRSRVHQVNKSFNLESPRTMTQMLDQELLEEHLIAELSTFFGGLALLLASIGLYGVLSYNVTQRTSEIGIRLAIGAQKGTVMWLILRETLLLVLSGAVIGTGAAIGLARLVQSRMFGVATWDPVTIAGATVVLALVATTAALLPALRAARVDPIIALRYE